MASTKMWFDSHLQLIRSGRCLSWGTSWLSACTIIGSSKRKIHTQNWPYIFLFGWGIWHWPDDTNIGGIQWKEVIRGFTVCPRYSRCAPYLHSLQIFHLKVPWTLMETLPLIPLMGWCVSGLMFPMKWYFCLEIVLEVWLLVNTMKYSKSNLAWCPVSLYDVRQIRYVMILGLRGLLVSNNECIPFFTHI